MRLKRIIAGVLLTATMLGTQMPVHACTGIYVGSECSENGSTFFGRSEDYQDNYCKVFGVSPAKVLPKGTIFKDVEGFRMPYHGKIFSYTYIKDASVYGIDMPKTNGRSVGEPFGAAGVNENGVSVTATVTTACNDRAGEADPLVAKGLRELSIPSILLGKARTARHAVRYLAKILDKYGSAECNSLMIGDTKEVWFFEILTGHQYAAVRMPKGKVSAQPNMILMGAIDVKDKRNVIASENLVKLAKDHGFLVTDAKGGIHVKDSYGPDRARSDTDVRYRQARHYFNSDLERNVKRKKISYSLTMKPKKKLSTLKILRSLAYRGKGSGCDEDKGCASYSIGNRFQEECHFFEIRKNLPKKLATIQWQAMADAEFSVYLPFYSALIEGVNPKYRVNANKYTKGSLNWVFSDINTICNDYRRETGKDLPGKYIRKYFELYQSALIKQQKKVDKYMLDLYRKNPELARRKATELGSALSEEVYRMADTLLDELNAYIAKRPRKAYFIPSAYKKKQMPHYAHLLRK